MAAHLDHGPRYPHCPVPAVRTGGRCFHMAFRCRNLLEGLVPQLSLALCGAGHEFVLPNLLQSRWLSDCSIQLGNYVETLVQCCVHFDVINVHSINAISAVLPDQSKLSVQIKRAIFLNEALIVPTWL